MKRPLVALIATLVIVVSLVSIYLSQRGPSININLKPFEGLGVVAAEETGKLLQGQGQVVVVTGEDKSLTTQKPAQVFIQEITKQKGITVKQESLSWPNAMAGQESTLSADQYVEVLQKYPDAAVIISFLGAPFFPSNDLSRVPAKRPIFIVASGFSRQLKGLLQAGVVQLALVPRFRPQAEEKADPQTPHEWFEKFFTIVTPETANELPGL